MTIPPAKTQPVARSAREPARSTRSRLNVDERRAQLLSLGLELFSGRTYDEISIDEIAKAAGISKGLLYHYFPSKRDYYVETVRFSADRLIRTIEEEAEGVKGTSFERLIAGLDTYLGYVEKHARGYATLVRSGIGADPEVGAIVEQTRQLFAQRVIEGMSISEPSPLLRTAMRGWVGSVEAASLDWLDHGDLERAPLRDLLAQTLLHTVRAAGVTVPAE